LTKSNSLPTKLIHLTKATLTTVTCCVKIQNYCSESFETRQGVRQGHVLSTLLFNVVQEVIVRRAKNHNYSHIDIVGRSQSAVREAYGLLIFRRFSWFLLGKVVSPNLKVQFYCSILIVRTMFCEN
jgi:hypothetical protein